MQTIKIFVTLALSIVVAFQNCLASDIPLWEQKQQEYQKQYQSNNYPGKQKQYEADLAKARLQNLQGEPLASILYNLADSIFNQYKFADAEQYYRESLAIREKNKSIDVKIIADIYYRIGMCCNSRAQRGDKTYLPEAINSFNKSINLIETKYGTECPELMAPISGLSVATMQSGDWQGGALIQQRLSKIMANQFGHDSTINAMHHRVLASAEESGGLKEAAQRDAEIYEQIKAKLPPGSLPPDSYGEWNKWVETRLKSRKKPTWMTDTSGKRLPPTAPALKPQSLQTPSTPPERSSHQTPTNTPTKSPVQTLPGAAPKGRVFYVQGHQVSYKTYCAVQLFNESLQLIADSKTNEALHKLQESLSLDSELPEVHCQLGQLLARTGDYDNALIELDSAIALDKSTPEAWVIKANIFQSKGDINAAVEAYNHFISLCPNADMTGKAQSAVRLLEKEISNRKIPSKLGSLAGADGRGDYLADISRDTAARWADSAMPIKVFIHKNAITQGYNQEFDSQLKQALIDWSNASSNKIKFAFVTDPSQANMDIMWTSDISQLSEPAEGGEAQSNIKGTDIEKADIILLTCSGPKNTNISPTRIKAVALHEIGHALGLLGHSPVATDIMYCAEGLSESPQELTNRDKKTICLLYSWPNK